VAGGRLRVALEPGVARHLDDGAAVDAAAGEYVDDFAPAVVGGNAAVLVSTPGGGPAATGCRRTAGARPIHHLVDLRGSDDALLDEVAAEAELVTRAARLHQVACSE